MEVCNRQTVCIKYLCSYADDIRKAVAILSPITKLEILGLCPAGLLPQDGGYDTIQSLETEKPATAIHRSESLMSANGPNTEINSIPVESIMFSHQIHSA
jgi:hypothetical protein